MLEVDGKNFSISFTVKKKLYPNEALAGASHAFSQIADVYAEESGPSLIVTLEPHTRLDHGSLEKLGGDFLNELLNQILCKSSLSENAVLTKYVATKALFSALRDEADPLQPPSAREERLTSEQNSESRMLLEKAQTDFLALQNNMKGR